MARSAVESSLETFLYLIGSLDLRAQRLKCCDTAKMEPSNNKSIACSEILRQGFSRKDKARGSQSPNSPSHCCSPGSTGRPEQGSCTKSCMTAHVSNRTGAASSPQDIIHVLPISTRVFIAAAAQHHTVWDMLTCSYCCCCIRD